MAKNQYTTVMQLNALSASDHGRRISMGLNMRGDVRVTKDGLVRVYVGYRFKVNTKIREVRLGVYPADSLTDLRAKRKAIQDQLDVGIDPIEQTKITKEDKAAKNLETLAELERRKQAAIAEKERIKLEMATKQARMTVRRFFDTWQSLELRRRKDGGNDVLRMFNKDVFPLIGEMALEDVKRAHIQEIVDNVTMRGVVRMNKAVLAAMRQMFNFAVDREIIEADPTARIKKASLGKDNERDRVLSSQEIIELFKKMPMSGLSDMAQLALLMQFATMTRISEVLAAKWSDVNVQERVWHIPETKNGKTHDVYLSDYALSKIAQLREHTGITPYLFPSARLDSGVCSKTITKQVADRQRGENSPMSNRTKQTDSLMLAGGQWRPHDLRRTGATIAVELGISPEAVERCLNHTEQSKIKRIYQRASYASEKKRAWQMLGDKLARLEQEALTSETSKVIPLRRA
jgi:integrase